MDHISKALERAQSEKQSIRSWVRPQAPDIDGHAEPPEALAGTIVELDMATLRLNHVLCDVHNDDPVVTDVYRLLRTRLLQLMGPNACNKIGITSPGPRAGKTLNTINLAFSIARAGNHNVLVVDADLRRPALAQTLGIEPEAGLIDYLSGSATLNEIAFSPTGIDRITMVVGRETESVSLAPDLLRSDRMSRLLRELDASHESTIILVDLPPITIGDDVIAVAPELDAMLLVVDEGGTELEQLVSTVDALAPFNLLGTVLNRSTERTMDTGGYYQAYRV